ncbi:MAG: type II toxin-antitoxin system HicB family antitoxin [Acidimicrobiaceae bacterium]|nr:type II toxin-antitoxin system HicB family antitoxin [Acidimicrobiaceae bacterium]
MLAYPIELEDDDGTVMATCPDFPEVVTFGGDRTECMSRAVDAIEEAIAARINGRQDIPTPSRGERCVTMPTLTAVKVLLHQRMQSHGVTKAELARRLGWHMPQVDRVLDINHRSRLDRMDAALGAFDCGLAVEVTSATDGSRAISRGAGGRRGVSSR